MDSFASHFQSMAYYFLYFLQFNLIQFILYSPILQICLKELYNLYTYDIPDPGPHIG